MNEWFGTLEPLAQRGKHRLLWTGAVTASAFAGGLYSARRAYQAAEERRIVAQNL